MIYLDYINKKPEEKIELLLNSLLETNRTFNYYVDFKKVNNNLKKYELELNILNYVIGKENIEEEITKLFNNYPEVIKTIPILLAIRDNSIDLLVIDEFKKNVFNLDFENINNSIEDYVKFIKEVGLLDFFKTNIKKSLLDYVLGVEVGLDSNARKNRSGNIMESLVEKFVKNICIKYGYEYKTQATSSFIKDKWNFFVPVDKSQRKFDFAIFNKIKNKVYLIETNYYGSNGSKLKAVANEFSELNKFLKINSKNVEFIWITDGKGWIESKYPLLEAFYKIENIFNLDMLEKGFLEELLINK